MYVGKIYTTASNSEASALNSYGIINLDFQQKLYIQKKPFIVSVKINNAANTVYTNMPERIMPGRNYHLQIIKKF